MQTAADTTQAAGTALDVVADTVQAVGDQVSRADSAAIVAAAADSISALGRQALNAPGATLWLPPQKSTTAHEIDALFYFIGYMSVLLTLIVLAAMVFFVWKYRRKSHTARPIDVIESKWLELSWVVVPTLLVMVVFFWGFRAYVSTAMPPSDAITINVKAQKWNWTFEYQNGTNAIDEIWVPIGTPIRMEMTSQDVLHSFFVPEVRIKHDVIPGRFSYVWFEAPEEGTYQVVCTEYCGTDHSNMGAKIHVVSRTAYYDILRNGPPGQGPVAPVDLGARIHSQLCGSCHSIDGSPMVGPTWQGIWGQPRPGTEQGEVNDAYIQQSIYAPQSYIVPGYGANMPNYDGQLNAADIRGIQAYIRQLSGAETEADLTVPEGDEAAAQDAEPAEGGMGDPGTPVADPVTPAETDAVRDGSPVTPTE